jgi:hypothetical protein
VLPALTASGVARGPHPDGTPLRDVLGLPRPVNRFAVSAPAADPAADSARSTSRA